ncbi:MAG TPA: alanine/ornithine racemase family PLP-dependent enzyme [Candidatus Coatesbacteria bacterium]|nr:alanine/ornithine racemase family PLP-dependent enzyme [Candidatus Coatesbacteria bacterium]
MAHLEISIGRVLANIRKLNQHLARHGKRWTLVAKLLSGHEPSLRRLLFDPVVEGLHSIADSRLSGLMRVKLLRPDAVTMYLKPPPPRLARSVVRYADISLNSSLDTIRALDGAAREAGVRHGVIVMLEMGELREGVIAERIFDFYARLLELENIKIIGIGTNLGCMHGVEPTYDKLIQLSLYRQLLEARLGVGLELVSGGSSITLPLLGRRKVPRGVDHFRIGEAALLGSTPLTGRRYRDLSTDTFDFVGQVLELERKPSAPEGTLGQGGVGHAIVPESGEPLYRVLVDFGMVDVDVGSLVPKDPALTFAGSTSDMTVYTLDENLDRAGRRRYRVGGSVHFKLDYMGAARLMHSKYIEKRVV